MNKIFPMMLTPRNIEGLVAIWPWMIAGHICIGSVCEEKVSIKIS